MQFCNEAESVNKQSSLLSVSLSFRLPDFRSFRLPGFQPSAFRFQLSAFSLNFG